MTIRLLIVDDHPVVRAGLRGMFAGQDEFEVIGEAADGDAAVIFVAKRSPDVTLMDLRMTDGDGLQAIRRIRARDEDAKILVLTTYDHEQDVIAAAQAGAVGYLLKDAPREELYAAVRAAAQGKTVWDAAVVGKVLDAMRGGDRNNVLSERETEMLRYVARGMTNKAISRELHISVATVKTHLHHVFKKLDVPDRASAVATAIERGLLRLERYDG